MNQHVYMLNLLEGSDRKLLNDLLKGGSKIHSMCPVTEGRTCFILEEAPKTEAQIIVEVRGGIAYCDDPRVKIIDHD